MLTVKEVSIHNSDVISLCQQAYNERDLVDHGLPQSEQYDYMALVAYCDDIIPVGMIIFRICNEDTCSILTRLSYVKPEYRRQGVFTELWKTLVNYAIANDISTIGRYIRASNTKMISIVEKQGSILSFLYYAHTVIPHSDM